jgi:hypothetical protein
MDCVPNDRHASVAAHADRHHDSQQRGLYVKPNRNNHRNERRQMSGAGQHVPNNLS